MTACTVFHSLYVWLFCRLFVTSLPFPLILWVIIHVHVHHVQRACNFRWFHWSVFCLKYCQEFCLAISLKIVFGDFFLCRFQSCIHVFNSISTPRTLIGRVLILTVWNIHVFVPIRWNLFFANISGDTHMKWITSVTCTSFYTCTLYM